MNRITVVALVDTVNLLEDMVHLPNKGADMALSLLRVVEDMELLLRVVERR